MSKHCSVYLPFDCGEEHPSAHIVPVSFGRAVDFLLLRIIYGNFPDIR